jgi:hypothetical protein
MPFLRRAFVGASVAWSFALPLAALAASAPHPSSAVYLLSLFVYLTGSLLCHQLPERSFHLWGAQMPVCARCTGIYAGAAIAAVIATLTARVVRRTSSGPQRRFFGAAQRATREAGSRATLGLAVAALPTVVTLVYEWTTGQTPANWIRAVAGAPIGVVAAWIVCGPHPERVEG